MVSGGNDLCNAIGFFFVKVLGKVNLIHLISLVAVGGGE